MIYTYDYDSGYPGPAFPAVELTLCNVVDAASSTKCKAWVDSGADATMIPVSYLQEIGARRVDQKRIYGITGVSQAVDIYEVTLQLGSHRLSRIYAVADKANANIILGRDVLNHMMVTLNGLAQVVEVSD